MFDQNLREKLEIWIDVDAKDVALKSGDAKLARAVDALKKAKNKLPDFYNARCSVTNVMVEQSSAQEVALAREVGRGRLAVDLTCGLGMDTYSLAKKFERVIAVEIDPERVEMAIDNFKRLGCNNVQVVCESAQVFMKKFDQVADLIFCDPSRRTEDGKRLYSLEDCAPNVVELMSVMKQKGRRIAIKLSPMFDVDELFRLFEGASVEVVSLNGECKEVVLHLGEGVMGGEILHTVLRKGEIKRVKVAENDRVITGDSQCRIEEMKFVYQPDVALYKSRSVEAYMKDYFPDCQFITGGYVFSKMPVEGFVGRGWEIDLIAKYEPKEIKKLLKLKGTKKITILHKDFNIPTELICKQLSVSEGGRVEVLFCCVDKTKMAVFVK